MKPDSEASLSLRVGAASLLSLAVCAMVWRYAWISEDAFITFRYVANVVSGHGAVFNIGEHVQGYTHPLWFLLLAVGNLFVPDLYYLAVGLGLALTVVAQLGLSLGLMRMGGPAMHGGLLAMIFATLCVSSGSWLSFQTGGLENPLSHWLLVMLIVEMLSAGLERAFVVSLLGALLVVNRPDFAIFFAPTALLLVGRLRESGVLTRLALGSAPLLAWVLFALAYYGDLVPNTAHAKVGIFATPADAIAQGFVYLKDWIQHEPLPAIATFVSLVLATALARTPVRLALALGVWLQLGYVIWVGGDFMRGRFLLAIFVASLVLGLCQLSILLKTRRLSVAWSAAGLAICVVLAVFSQSRAAAPVDGIPPSGIIDERLFYPGYHLSYYRESGSLMNPYLNLRAVSRRLRVYARACGPVTLHTKNPGTIGYLTGPQVSFIDLLGLTDRTIAKLPNELLMEARPRVGHPEKRIPVSYLAKRGDIALIENWRKQVFNRNCALKQQPQAYADSKAYYVGEDLPVIRLDNP